jgi:hypothetical protein
MTTTMCAKRGTPATFAFGGDTDGLDDGLLGEADDVDVGLLGEAVAVGVPVVVVLGGVDAADDPSVGDAIADDATPDEADARGDVAVAGSWLASAEALELRGWELVHPDTNRAKAATAEHPATLALNITNRLPIRRETTAAR